MSFATALGFRARPDARSDVRTRVLLLAKMVSAGNPAPIYVLDLSRKGVLGHAIEPPEVNEIVWIVCKGVESLARTAWVRGNRFGLAFETDLPMTKYEVLLGEGRRSLSAGRPLAPLESIAA